MHCEIKYVGKARNGISKYWCLTHKALASNKQGNKLDFCLYEKKDRYNKTLFVQDKKIERIQIVFDNLLKNKIPSIYINDTVFEGVLIYEDMVLDDKDFVGFFLAQLNHVSLEKVCCSHCGHIHSDNGKFAYTPHKTHLCLYCGHFFRVKEENIGSEMAILFPSPEIKLEKRKQKIENVCSITYDMFSGSILINGQTIDTIIIDDREESLVTFLNNQLKDLY